MIHDAPLLLLFPLSFLSRCSGSPVLRVVPVMILLERKISSGPDFLINGSFSSFFLCLTATMKQ
jgi:hypothetical protein